MKDGKQVLDGSFTLFTNEGEPVKISYVADNDGGESPVVKGDAVPTNTSNPEIEDFTSTPEAMPMSTEVWNN